MGTIQKKLEEVGLDFIPVKRPAYYSLGRSKKRAPDAFALIRSDNQTYLGMVGKDYTPVGVAKALSFLDPLVEDPALCDGDPIITSFRGGKVVSIRVNLHGAHQEREYCIQKSVTVLKGNVDRAIRAVMTPSVTKEDGTQVVIPQSAGNFVFRHTTRVHDRLYQATRLLNLTDEMLVSLQNDFRVLSQVRAPSSIEAPICSRLLDIVTPPREKGPGRVDRQKSEDCLNRALAQEGASLLDVFLSMVEYTTRFRRSRKNENLEWGNLAGRGVDMVTSLRYIAVKYAQEVVRDREEEELLSSV